MSDKVTDWIMQHWYCCPFYYLRSSKLSTFCSTLWTSILLSYSSLKHPNLSSIVTFSGWNERISSSISLITLRRRNVKLQKRRQSTYKQRYMFLDSVNAKAIVSSALFFIGRKISRISKNMNTFNLILSILSEHCDYFLFDKTRARSK